MSGLTVRAVMYNVVPLTIFSFNVNRSTRTEFVLIGFLWLLRRTRRFVCSTVIHKIKKQNSFNFVDPILSRREQDNITLSRRNTRTNFLRNILIEGKTYKRDFFFSILSFQSKNKRKKFEV